jgi:hypothetical protein
VKYSNWHSIHIFIHDFQSHDLFIKKYLVPFIHKTDEINAHFFIRYWQGGPHIRFRFQTENVELISDGIGQLIAEFKKEYQPSVVLTPENFYAHHKFDGRETKKETLYWMNDLSTHFISYQPELDRYGDGEQLRLNETLFEYSTVVAESFISQLPENHLLLKLLVCYYMFEKVEKFLSNKQYESVAKRYEEFWLYYRNQEIDYTKTGELLDKLGNKVSSNQLVYPMLMQYEDALVDVLTKLSEITEMKFFQYMMISQVHMFNNRLGLPVEFEHMLGARIVAKRRKINGVVL